MMESNRSVKNTLFNPSVTGNTFEDFSQNAMLLPALQPTPKPPLPSPTINMKSGIPGQLNSSTIPQQQTLFATVPPPSDNFQENSPHHSCTPNINPTSGILNPVNYFNPSISPSTTNPLPPPPALTASSQNTFRRSGIKRAVYAPVPGLTSDRNAPSIPSLPQVQDTPFSVENQFKPINPQPACPSFPSIKPSIFHTTGSAGTGPVMDAISATEALPQPSTPSTPQPSINTSNGVYRPVYHHWFYRRGNNEKTTWVPFSMIDSLALEQAFTSADLDTDKMIATDGGRFDVNILRRQRTPVYWKGEVNEVSRCSWFYKNNTDRRYVPYDENVATRLEEEYKLAYESNKWHTRVQLANGEAVEFHGPDVLVLLPPDQTTDAWTNTPTQEKPRVVKRGMDEFDIDEGEPSHVDHVLFMVHGIGSVCDFKFRNVEEVVDEFRNIALQLTQAHYKSSCEQGIVNRVEVLPVSWHGQLHSDETGVDEQLKKITLESIPKLREFTNDTILDVLFYTSPLYCQTIISTVGEELNRIYNLFKKRNPSFNGGVSLGGHSLGSLILFDLLAHQREDDVNQGHNQNIVDGGCTPPDQRKVSRRISYMMGTIGGGQAKISYSHLEFKPSAFFALGSPIGMFVTVRGLNQLGESFCLPTCPAFFNIFHPYDPVAYRIEALVNPDLAKLKPVLIPHHKGRKRMHLELKETMARVGADLKQKVLDSMKNTWNSFYQLALFHKPDHTIEDDVQKQQKLETTFEDDEQLESEPVQEVTNIPLGRLNNSRRIDYVLQEAPLEFINEYFFALTSHVCYWESEDTILMILKEIYGSMDIRTDSKIPQQTMTIERRVPINFAESESAFSVITTDAPPLSGFERN